MTESPKPNGCFVSFQRIFSGLLALVATVFLIAVIFSLVAEVKIQGASLLVLVASSFFVLRYLWKKVAVKSVSNKQVFKNILSSFFRTIIVIVLFTVILIILKDNYHSNDITRTDDDSQTEIVETTEGEETIRYIINKMRWRDFDGDRYQMNFKIAENNVQKSKTNRESYRYTRNFTWGQFYKHMADHDQPLLEHLYTEFSKIQKQRKMNRTKFAEFIITSIQNIQYNYIKSTPCDGTEDYPCVGNVRLGIFAPVEFSANLKGDCDSRTVLLFVLLAKFNYEVAILNSDQYKHSVLGINVHARGKYKTYNRKKYYFVETTATGCPIGYLPNNVSTLSYWNFVLVN
ncbi:hypothetical protein [Kordia zhangzhouensis]|uniref:hypothetical protein n=1 Tax=Kordia zhangzhouensis TaxID=1620405 RepID=UPI0006290A0D|nr:hypothetical protein [Kordia zhangzhouensis]